MTTPAQTMTELADEIEGDLHHRVLQVITEKRIGLIVAALRSAAVPQGVREALTFDDNTTDWRKIAPELEPIYNDLCTRLQGSVVDETMEYIARVFRAALSTLAEPMTELADAIESVADNISPTRYVYPATEMLKWAKRLREFAAIRNRPMTTPAQTMTEL